MDQNQTVKVGDKEFSVEELTDLVTRGQTYKELETKYNTKLDRVVPEYTKATQRVKELEALEPKVQTYEQKLREIEERDRQPQRISEEQKIAALKQLTEMGVLTKGELETAVMDIIDRRVSLHFDARNKVSETEKAVTEFNQSYGLEAEARDVINYMAENGIKTPRLALKEMFASRLDELEADRKNKEQEDYFTQTSTNTGAKQYKSNLDTKDKDAVRKAIREALRS